MSVPSTIRAVPALLAPGEALFDLRGEVGRRLAAVTAQWILPAPSANPGMLEMFRDRDRLPYREMMPWAGEFAGKYLTHAVQIYRLTGDSALREHLHWFVGELTTLQDADGYLGPWPREARILGTAPNCAFGGRTWDAWGHYHVMLGLLLWHETTDDSRALACCTRMAEMFCRRFLDGGEDFHQAGGHEMNQAPVHALALLYQRTGEPRWLAMAQKIVRQFARPPAGDYLRAGLAGVPFWATPKPRWESLHPIMGLVELYYATGEADYRRAFEQLWWSMLEGDRHNNGGFTSGEKATGNPYHGGAIETCCTVAWMAMSVEMLKLTGNPVVADELELSLFNSGFGMMSPSGRWVTYNTPMAGAKSASAHEIVFQARPGTSELNCCSVNGPRVLGLLSAWALLARPDGLVVNYYGPGSMSAVLPSGNRVALLQRTDYPYDGQVAVAVDVTHPETFTLALRIPAWSHQTSVTVNGTPVEATPGSYLELAREWRTGDDVRLTFDFSPHAWAYQEMLTTADWVTDWRVFGPVPPAATDYTQPELLAAHRIAPAMESLTALPETLTIDDQRYSAVTVYSDDGLLDVRRIYPQPPERAVMLAFTELVTETAQTLTLRLTADWWTAWYVNGVKVFDNHDAGGDGSTFSSRHQTVELPLRAGHNLIALHQSGGNTHNAWLSLGICESPSQRAARLAGRLELATSLYRGPILLAYDRRFNPARDGLTPPSLDAATLALTLTHHDGWLSPAGLWVTPGVDGDPVYLCDFGHAGLAGNAYESWLPIRFDHDPRIAFTQNNPLRSTPV